MSRSLNHGFEDKCSEKTFTEIYNMAYARGIEKGKDIGIADERDRIAMELEKAKSQICLDGDDLKYYCDGIYEAIEIVRGDVNENEI